MPKKPPKKARPPRASYECEHAGCGENFSSDELWEEARAVIIVNGWDRDNVLIRLPAHEDGKTVLASAEGWIVVEEEQDICHHGTEAIYRCPVDATHDDHAEALSSKPGFCPVDSCGAELERI
jgi:hypothetical protein